MAVWWGAAIRCEEEKQSASASPKKSDVEERIGENCMLGDADLLSVETFPAFSGVFWVRSTWLSVGSVPRVAYAWGLRWSLP